MREGEKPHGEHDPEREVSLTLTSLEFDLVRNAIQVRIGSLEQMIKDGKEDGQPTEEEERFLERVKKLRDKLPNE